MAKPLRRGKVFIVEAITTRPDHVGAVLAAGERTPTVSTPSPWTSQRGLARLGFIRRASLGRAFCVGGGLLR